MRYTPHLRNLLEYHKQKLPAGDFADLEKEVERLVKVWIEKLSAIESPIARAKLVHYEIDALNAGELHTHVTCQKGCAHCCHLEVEITEDDAARLADYLFTEGIIPNRERLKDQKTRERQGPEWATGATLENRCVLLGDDNCCRAYEARPTICRKHMVVSPVNECFTPEGHPIPRVLPLAEVVLSAMISLPGQRTGSLPKMLSEYFGEEVLPEKFLEREN